MIHVGYIGLYDTCNTSDTYRMLSVKKSADIQAVRGQSAGTGGYRSSTCAVWRDRRAFLAHQRHMERGDDTKSGYQPHRRVWRCARGLRAVGVIVGIPLAIRTYSEAGIGRRWTALRHGWPFIRAGQVERKGRASALLFFFSLVITPHS